ncbi:MAG: STAS domain-containing protein [Candidatus Aminicenantes bacterium]|nr:STAS domain-containing protein [Candidatus Aminicenantes bacterium]
MKVREGKIDSFALVEIIGRVNSENSESLKNYMQELGKREQRILVDCSALEYISSSGLGALLVLLKLIQEKGGTLRLFSLSPRITEVFAIAGFDKFFLIFPNLEAARLAKD